MHLPTVLNSLRTVTVCITPVERSLSAISGKMIIAAPRPRNGIAEKKPFWNHQTASANNSTRRPKNAQTSAKANPDTNPDSIGTSDADDFQNSTGTSLFKATFVITFTWRSAQFVPIYDTNCGKMPSQYWTIL